MSNKSPFLTLDDRVDYLYHKKYFAQDSFSEDDKVRLQTINFHYFLGYARNFRALHFEGKMIGEKIPSEVFKLIDIDANVSEALYSGIRRAEWLLRNFFVQEYCGKYSPYGSFLDFENYLDPRGSYSNRNLAQGLMTDILGYREQYVVDKLSRAWRHVGSVRGERPKRCTDKNWEDCQNLFQDLALWSVVDSFSLGRLVELIQRCDNDTNDDQHISRRVATDMGIPHKRFRTGMNSLRSLRNLISHQARLWMRPTTYTVSQRGQFRTKLDGSHEKAMLSAFYNVASFQGEKLKRLEFAERLESLIDRAPNYKYGISHLLKNT